MRGLAVAGWMLGMLALGAQAQAQDRPITD